MTIRTISVILLSFLTTLIFAQSKNVEFNSKNFPNRENELKQALKDIEDGKYYYNNGFGNSEIAIDYFLRANRFNPNNAELHYYVGLCYLDVLPISEAIKHLYIAYELNPQVSPEFELKLGIAYHTNLDFDQAIEHYKKFKRSLKPNEVSTYQEYIDRKIFECECGITMKQNPQRVVVESLGSNINSIFNDYGPIVVPDESVLYFTSRRDNTTGGNKDNNDFEYFEDIYLAENKGEYWFPAKNMGKEINSIYHDAIIGLSPDGQTLLMYIDENGGDVFYSKLKGDKWSSPKPFPSPINSKYHEPAASLAYDNRGLFFVSDRPGGYGEKDIYYSKQDKNGKWSEPENLGAAINTKYNEIGVFAMPDGKTIYFSSQGHTTMGGYDIFKSTFENGRWGEPVNLGYPINSAGNDVFFSISASGRHGYFSSVRNGGFGGQDIYMVNFFGPEKEPVMNNEDNLIAGSDRANQESVIEKLEQISTTKLMLVKGQITDAISGYPVQAQIEIVDNSKNELIATFESNSSTGRYLVSLPAGKNYGIAVKADDYLFHSENFDVSDNDGFKVVVKDIRLKKVEVGNQITLNNIFFEFQKSELNMESISELNRLVDLMKTYPTLKIEVAGHTDNIGGEEYNLKLSQDRAKAVVDYLVKNGISASRLTFIGYGLTKPVATNETEEGRKLNRRSEIKIIEK